MHDKKNTEKVDEIEDFKSYIKKKKAQTKVLKKIIEKMNTDENPTINK